MKSRLNILNMKRFLITPLIVISVLLICSCKKEMAESPTVYDSAVDGIAVVPVPDIDIRMAERDATVPGYRNTAAFEGQIVRTPDLADELAAPILITDPNFL